MSDTPGIVVLRECMVFVHSWMSALLGTDRGKKSSFSPVALGILYMSYFHKIKMGDIPGKFNISRSTATDYVNNLEKRGYVRRVKDESDKRDIYIIPDKKGEKWILETETAIFSFLNSRLSVLSQDEQETFLSLLSKFTGYGDGKDHECVLMETLKTVFLMKSEVQTENRIESERVCDMVRRVYGKKERFLKIPGGKNVYEEKNPYS